MFSERIKSECVRVGPKTAMNTVKKMAAQTTTMQTPLTTAMTGHTVAGLTVAGQSVIVGWQQ